MPNENIVFDGDALTNEGVTRDLASPSNYSILLDFDKCTDLCVIADFAPIEVNEYGKLDIFSLSERPGLFLPYRSQSNRLPSLADRLAGRL